MSCFLNPGRGDPGAPPTPALALPTSPGVPGGPGTHLPHLRGGEAEAQERGITCPASTVRSRPLGLDVPQPRRLTLSLPRPEEAAPHATWSLAWDPHLFCK